MPRKTFSFNKEDLIREIEIRPAVWDVSCIQYRNIQFRNRQWDEICEKSIPCWNEFSEMEKKAARSTLRIKWGALRAMFKQAVVNPRSPEEAEQTIKKHFPIIDNLHFLLPNYIYGAMICESDGEDSNAKSVPDKKEEKPEIKQEIDIKEEPCIEAMPFATKTIMDFNPIINVKVKDEPCDSNGAMENSAEDDRDFLLSLLPTFQNLGDTQKIQVKVQFLQILKSKLLENNT